MKDCSSFFPPFGPSLINSSIPICPQGRLTPLQALDLNLFNEKNRTFLDVEEGPEFWSSTLELSHFVYLVSNVPTLLSLIE